MSSWPPAPVEEPKPDITAAAVTTWDEGTALAPGDTVDLTLRLTAPETAEPGEAAQIAVTTARITTAVPDPALGDPDLTLDAAVEEPEFEAASIISEEDALDCSEPNGDRVVPGGTVVYRCRISGLSGLTTEIVADIDDPHASWDVELSSVLLNQTSAFNNDGIAQINTLLLTNLLSDLIVTVKAPLSATPGSTKNVGMTVRTCLIGCSTVGTASIQTTVGSVAPVTGTFSALGVDIASFACYPANASGNFNITQGGQLQITCSLYTLLSASLIGTPGVQLGFSTITSTFPANWGVAYVINGQSYTALSGVAISLGSLNLLTLSTNGVFSFSVLLSAPCNATLGPASIGLSTALDVNLLGLGVSTGLGPSVTLPPNVQSGSFGAVTATFVDSGTPVAFGTAPITGLTGATQTGSAQLTVNRPACAGATVSVGVSGSGGNFNAPAGSDGNPIPLANLSLTSVSSSPSDSGLTVASVPGGGTAVTTNPTVATVNALTGTAAYTLTLGASLAVPPETRTGTHTATLQVTVTGATP